MIRHGERHDGDGYTYRAVRHIRGGHGSPAILAMDSARASDSALFYIQEAIVELAFTSVQVKAIRATPQTLVAAPGAGYFLEFVDAWLMLDYGSNVFTESTDNLQVKYTDGSGAAASQAIETTGFIDQSADTYTNALAKIDTIVAAASLANQALVLHNTGDGEIAGNAANDNVLRVRVRYRIHQVLA